MLIDTVGLHMKRHGAPIERSAEDFGPQTDRRRKLDSARGVVRDFPQSFHLQRDAFRVLGILQIHFRRPDGHAADGERSPIGRNVRRKCERSRPGIRL